MVKNNKNGVKIVCSILVSLLLFLICAGLFSAIYIKDISDKESNRLAGLYVSTVDFSAAEIVISVNDVEPRGIAVGDHFVQSSGLVYRVIKIESGKVYSVKTDINLSGVDGEDGINGVDGKDGINGVDGKDGINGVDGKDGINGVDGKDGERGTIFAYCDYAEISDSILISDLVFYGDTTLRVGDYVIDGKGAYYSVISIVDGNVFVSKLFDLPVKYESKNVASHIMEFDLPSQFGSVSSSDIVYKVASNGEIFFGANTLNGFWRFNPVSKEFKQIYGGQTGWTNFFELSYGIVAKSASFQRFIIYYFDTTYVYPYEIPMSQQGIGVWDYFYETSTGFFLSADSVSSGLLFFDNYLSKFISVYSSNGFWDVFLECDEGVFIGSTVITGLLYFDSEVNSVTNTDLVDFRIYSFILLEDGFLINGYGSTVFYDFDTKECNPFVTNKTLALMGFGDGYVLLKGRFSADSGVYLYDVENKTLEMLCDGFFSTEYSYRIENDYLFSNNAVEDSGLFLYESFSKSVIKLSSGNSGFDTFQKTTDGSILVSSSTTPLAGLYLYNVETKDLLKKNSMGGTFLGSGMGLFAYMGGPNFPLLYDESNQTVKPLGSSFGNITTVFEYENVVYLLESTPFSNIIDYTSYVDTNLLGGWYMGNGIVISETYIVDISQKLMRPLDSRYISYIHENECVFAFGNKKFLYADLSVFNN